MRIYRPLHILLIITLGIFILPGCKKETTNTLTPISAADQKLERQIQSFKQRIFSNLKDGETLEADSIRWYLEASANYTLGDACAKNESVAIDSFMLNIPISQNYTSLNDVELAFNTISENVTDFSHGIPSVDKQTLCIAIKETSQTADTLQLKVTSTVVYGAIVGDWLFQPGQSWMYGDGLGNCNGNYLGQDAATEIVRRISLRRAVPFGNYYYTDFRDVQIDPLAFPRPGVPPGNVGYCYLFFERGTWPNFHACLPYDECNLYLTGTEFVIYTVDTLGGARPSTDINWNSINYSFIYLDLIGTLQLNSSDYVHIGTVHYGVVHQTGQET